jgi:hypothetical protein
VNERARWHRRGVLFKVLGFIALFFILTSLYKHVASWAQDRYAARRVEVTCVDIYDRHVAEAVKEWFSNAECKGLLASFQAQGVAADVMSTFPLIKAVSWQRYEPEVVRCTVFGVRPLYLINDKYIAGNNGQLYSMQDFHAYNGDLPRICISKQWLTKTLFPSVFRIFAALPSHVLKSYNIFFHDPYMVVCAPSDPTFAPHVVCVVDERSFTKIPETEALGERARTFIDEEERAFDSAYVCCDMRFDGGTMNKMLSAYEFESMQRVEV